MIIPVRCMTCGKPIGGLWDSYKKRVSSGEVPATVLSELGITRYCCRMTFLTQKDQLADVAVFRA
jgi:DNA-directed RNA polymerase subunit N